jgi:hypothetical protein
MDTETETLVAVLHDRMEKMTPGDRLGLMRSLMDGYCKECGYEDPKGNCQCWNDE